MDTENGIETRLVNIDRDLLIIPNLAIHMNRAANDGVKLLANIDTLPLFGLDREPQLLFEASLRGSSLRRGADSGA